MPTHVTNELAEVRRRSTARHAGDADPIQERIDHTTGYLPGAPY